MRRRFFLLSAGAALGAAATRSLAQPTPAPKRVGGLYPGSGTASSFPRAFESRLRELGWIEGRNLVFVNRSIEGDPNRYDALARELAAEKVDVIHAVFSTAVRAARKAAPNTPIVFSIVGDPVADGLVASLARPGGNITGASTRDTELYPKRIQLVRDMLPRAKRVGLLFDTPGPEGLEPRLKRSQQDLVEAGERLGLKIDSHPIGSVADVGPAIDKMKRDGVDAVLAFIYFRLPGDDRKVLIEHAVRTRLPTVYVSTLWTEMGGLATYSTNLTELGRRAADYVDKILRGTKPADLPVEEPNAFELVINRKAASAIGLTIPQAVLLRADRVID